MKHDYETTVAFRRKHGIKGDFIRIVGIPLEASFTADEREAIQKAVSDAATFYVNEGDETGVLIQLLDNHDLTWLPSSHILRTA